MEENERTYSLLSRMSSKSIDPPREMTTGGAPLEERGMGLMGYDSSHSLSSFLVLLYIGLE